MYAIRSYYVKWLNHLSQSAGKLKGLIDGLLDYSRCEMVQKEIKTILFVKNVITSYSIHYTKLYERNKPFESKSFG